MVLPRLRLGPKLTQRDIAIALEAIVQAFNKLREELEALSEEDVPGDPGSIVVNWSDILGVPGTFPPSLHFHADTLGVVQHADNPLAERTQHAVVLWIGTVTPFGVEEGGHALDGDLLLLLNFM